MLFLKRWNEICLPALDLRSEMLLQFKSHKDNLGDLHDFITFIFHKNSSSSRQRNCAKIDTVQSAKQKPRQAIFP